MPPRVDLPPGPARLGGDPLDPAVARAVAAYDAAADRRDDRALGFLTRAADRTIAALDLVPGMHVLDVACGTGPASIMAGRAVAPHGRVLGVDLSSQMLDAAREKTQRAGLDDVVRYQQADMRTTGLPDASFDAVVCVFGLVLVPDMVGLVAELWRMVRPGGTLIVTTWGPRLWAPMYEVWKAAVAVERPDLIRADEPWEQVTDTTALAALFEAAGVPEEGMTVTPEFERWPLLAPRDWWSIVLGSGLRWTIDQLDDDAVERVRETCLDYARRHQVDWISCNVLYGKGTKPAG